VDLGGHKVYFKKNSGMSKVKYLVIGFIFQLFKRATNSVISKKLFNDQKILLFPNCNISTMYMYTKIPDKNEILLLRELALHHQKEIIFLDIGANIGSYSICMMDICPKIIAFEPHPFTVKRCKMNFLLNNFDDSNVKQLALSNEIGKIHFSDFGGSSTINHIIEKGGIEVIVNTLDNFVKENDFSNDVSYILKVDVEGFEKQVFEGGKEFLTNYDIRGIVFECFSKDDVFEVLKSYGFLQIEKISENNYFATKNLLDR
jgi:FkbM family methyltransferase